MISFCIGTFQVQALDEADIQDLQFKGDIYGLFKYREELPTKTTPYRVTIDFSLEKFVKTSFQGYIKISEEEYNSVKPYQETINQHQKQYNSIFEPLCNQYFEIMSQIELKVNERKKLEASLQQASEEEKKQIQEQLDQIGIVINDLDNKRGNLGDQILNEALKIDDSVEEAIVKMDEFASQKKSDQSKKETMSSNTEEISNPGYYLFFSVKSLLEDDSSLNSTYGLVGYELLPLMSSVQIIEVPETPKEEVVEEPEVENPSTGIQNIILGGGMIVICSLTGIYLMCKKKLFVK